MAARRVTWWGFGVGCALAGLVLLLRGGTGQLVAVQPAQARRPLQQRASPARRLLDQAQVGVGQRAAGAQRAAERLEQLGGILGEHGSPRRAVLPSPRHSADIGPQWYAGFGEH